jgi:homoserine O-succinyltransferase
MALIRNSNLPAFERLRSAGAKVSDRAAGKLPQVNVGLVNLMPDAALTATERQFLYLVEAYAEEADLVVHLATLAAQARGDAARAHIGCYYDDLNDLCARKLDALIVTGANPAQELLPDEAFWGELTALLDWAQSEGHSVMCSCLATHAVIEHLFGTRRQRLPAKQWGVYGHRLVNPDHPLLDGLPDDVIAPHSHNFDLSAETMRRLGLDVLMESDVAGVHMAVMGDRPDFVFFQGHPEYDAVSLLKEYKREVARYVSGERDDYPPFPDNYFDDAAAEILRRYKNNLKDAINRNGRLPVFPESDIKPGIGNTWTEAGRCVYRNWLAIVLGGRTR